MQTFAAIDRSAIDPGRNASSELTPREMKLLLGTLDSVIKFHLVKGKEPELKAIRSKFEIQAIRQ